MLYYVTEVVLMCESTWDGVVQHEAEETADKHAGCQKNLQHLVELYHTWKRRTDAF